MEERTTRFEERSDKHTMWAWYSYSYAEDDSHLAFKKRNKVWAKAI